MKTLFKKSLFFKVKYFGFAVILMFCLLLIGCADDAEVSVVDSAPEEVQMGDEEAESVPDVETHETEEEGPLAGNSRTNPAGLNEVFKVEKDDLFAGRVIYEIELTEIISGSEALTIVREANRFNEIPEEGKEYILARFRFKIIETEADEPYNVNHAQFDVVSEDGITYDDFISVSGLEPNLRRDLYEGAELDGYTYFIVNQDDAPVAAYDRGRSGEIWFDLRAE